MRAGQTSIWRMEYVAKGRYHVDEITAPTLLDAVILTLRIHPEADFARATCVVTSWPDGGKKKL